MAWLSFAMLALGFLLLIGVDGNYTPTPDSTKCYLQRGFTVGEVEPWNGNFTCGCKVTTDSTSDDEYHFFSSYKSASINNTIDILLTVENRAPKPVVRLFLVSFDQVKWRLTADKPITLNQIRLDAPLGRNQSVIDVDTSVVTVEGSIARSQRYSGRVLLPSDGDCVRLSSDIVDKQKRNKGFLSSFTAVYSASSATLPIGLENPLLHSGTENNRGVYDDITSTADDSGYWEVNQTTSSTTTPTSLRLATVPIDNSSFTLPLSLSFTGLAVIVALVIIAVVILKKSRNTVTTSNDCSLQRDLLTRVNEFLPERLIVRGSELKIGCLLGEGHFGLVYEGYCNTNTDGYCLHDGQSSMPRINGQLNVAVKSIRGCIEDDDLNQFLKECSSMQSLDHPNVLRLVGVCVDHQKIEGPLILTPYMVHGDLKSYLARKVLESQQPTQAVSLRELLSYVIQICSGMAYLASRSIVHRDLAARNCMLSEKKIVNIADFGMARFTNEKEYYRQRSNIPVPIKWMAPESVLQKVYSEKSDVWSFGITAWEIFSLGKPPYTGVPNDGVLDYLYAGNRLTCPVTCPPKLFDICASCWTWASTERHDFKNLLHKLEDQCDPQMGYSFHE